MTQSTAIQINRYCESRWGLDKTASINVRDFQHQVKEFLSVLGWSLPLPFSLQPETNSDALSFLLRIDENHQLASYFTWPGSLSKPSAILSHGLDFSTLTHMLVRDAQQGKLQYVFICDLNCAYLYDTKSEELLLHAEDVQSFKQDFVAVISSDAVSIDALKELRHPPRSAAARQLREWSLRWVTFLIEENGLSHDTATILTDRVLMLRFLFQCDLFRRTRKRHEQRLKQLIEQAKSTDISGCGIALVRLFHDMWLDWRIDLMERIPELDTVLERDALAAALLQEVDLISCSKFSVENILESFNYGNATEKLRVRMVPDDNDERELYLEKQTINTIDDAHITIDLHEEGYRDIFHWFDKIATLYEQLDFDFAQHLHGAHKDESLDLLTWSQCDATRPHACSDRFAHACEKGITLYYSDAQQLRVGRLMLTLHLINCYNINHMAVERFPSVMKALVPRPDLIAANRIINTYKPF